MESVRQSVRPKHQVLILKCFPRYQKGVLEVKPNPSELSYLLYYASTRRSKLQKVGAFLEKKTARDVSRGRIGNVQVVLQILTALIEKLPRELPLYGHSILNILETVLRSNDIAMVEDTLQTFETFCSNQDLAILAAEQRYATQYERIVRSYAEFASSESSIPSISAATTLPTRLRWKNIGLKAMRSIVSSEALSADGGKPVTFIVPVILENVYDGGEDLLLLQQTSQTTEKTTPEQGRRRRASTVTVRTVDTAEGNVAEASGTTADADKVAELEVRLLALKCLERIFVVSSNRSQIRTAAGLVLQFIVSKRGSPQSEKALQDYGKWANSLMDLITKWCPVQDRFIILFTAVEILRGISSDRRPIGQQIVMASLIDSLLKSPVNMIGLSVIDVLVGFVQHILRILQAPSSQSNLPTPTGSTTDGALQPNPILTGEHAELVSLLKQCIADLATHNYYADQISDMIRTLLKRIRPSGPLDVAASTKTPSDPNASAYHIPSLAGEGHVENYFYSSASRIVALEAVKDILEVANQGKTTTGLSIEPRNKVGIQVWEATHWLLRDSERDVRITYANAFISWLELETTKSDLQVPDLPSSRPSRVQSKREYDAPRRTASLMPTDKVQNQVSSAFLQLLHLALYETTFEYAETKEDILVVYALLVTLVEHLGVNAVRFGLPMVLKLQSDFFGSTVSQVNIGSLVYGYLNALVGKFGFEASRVGNEIQSEISRRKSHGVWLEMVLLPPVSPGQIPSPAYDNLPRPAPQEPLRSFTSVEELVQHIEVGYVTSLMAALQNVPGSPGKQTASSQSPGHGYFEASQNPPTLPADVKDDMLSIWSKEACVAVLEKEKTRASSVAGSKNGNSIRRSHGSHLNGYGSQTPNDTGSTSSQYGYNNTAALGAGPGSSSSSRAYRRPSNRAEGSPGVSSRDSTIRVNDLKRMLTVAGNSNVRRSSPLRGRLDATSNSSILSSSSESFVSGTFSASDFDAGSRPQSIREGSETPKASSSSSSQIGGSGSSEYNHDVIPPVPPLPLGLVIPGDYPDSSSSNISRQNSTRSDDGRSSGSPSQLKSGGRSTAAQLGQSLSGKRTRSINSLHKATGLRQQQQQASHASSPTTTGSDDIRRDIEKLLDGVLSPDNNSNTLKSIDPSQGITPRRKTSGIGRPPY
ncbi:hypothetical protein UA08_04119 [Talaromyces atroroseus]|uniref:Protein EFR3 n=1 Tax=Talaromyces atroroseus TaxID=1441469 RepID=A0A1Q5Q9K8_TALAT|nr:hypothetical protein UA08_04119 [Talaromyces atroroseus]OKL60709.1 hypothetical protein UA08_04119 [Talaromyces atroroseus]